MTMLHHLSLAVADLSVASAFYDAALLPLGYIRVWTADDAVGYGPPGDGDKFAIKVRTGPLVPPSPGFHVAFTASTHGAVDGFFAAAMESGGRDDGGPGFRPRYGPDYYAAFVIDPDGYRIEAVCNAPARSIC